MKYRLSIEVVTSDSSTSVVQSVRDIGSDALLAAINNGKVCIEFRREAEDYAKAVHQSLYELQEAGYYNSALVLGYIIDRG